jgi:hypothetical protein
MRRRASTKARRRGGSRRGTEDASIKGLQIYSAAASGRKLNYESIEAKVRKKKERKKDIGGKLQNQKQEQEGSYRATRFQSAHALR